MGSSSVTGDETIGFFDNMSFDGTARGGKMTTNGELWIGSTASPHVKKGNIVAGTGVTVNYVSPNIVVSAAGSMAVTFSADSGSATPAANNLNVFGGTGVSTSGAGSTITINAEAAVPLSFPTDSGTATPAANSLSILATTAAAGTSPLSTSGAGDTVTITAQISQAIGATNASNIGLAAFDSADFTVDANGFVQLNGGAAGQTITGDSGGALSPTAGNWNILGRSGSKTSGSGSTLTVNSPPFSQEGGNGTSVLNSGEFVTATATRTLPATAGLADGDLVIYACTTANPLTVTANTGQTIRLGTAVTASGGTAVSTAIGDSLTLRFNATAVSWYAVSSVGIWVLT